MERRNFLEVSAAAALAAAATARADEPMAEHAHHHGSSHQALAAAAGDCVAKGEACLTHCHELLATGDKSLGECAKRDSEMLAVCRAMQSVAYQDGASLPKLARVCLEVCKACEEECRKHAEKHAICRECGDACKRTAQECEKVAA
jgi:Cys-rich four helix bundle protein (predicted Tat secretion target)